MIGLYFSGTGNSKWALNTFCSEYDSSVKTYSIEDNSVIKEIENSDTIIFAYPIYFSSLPKILKDFIVLNKALWKNKKIFAIATMGLFSGDGAGCLKRLLKKYGAKTIGGLHLKMPDSIGDEKVLKRPIEKNRLLIKNAEEKIKKSAERLKKGKPTKNGLNFLSHMIGLFGQRLWFGHKTKNYSNKLKINSDTCIGCGKCVKLCPMNNIVIENNRATQNNKCTMCYRCINNCPKQSITLLGKKVVEQCTIEKYID